MTKCGHFLNIVSYCLSVSFSNILAAVQRPQKGAVLFSTFFYTYSKSISTKRVISHVA
jgi:hypothetical protein